MREIQHLTYQVKALGKRITIMILSMEYQTFLLQAKMVKYFLNLKPKKNLRKKRSAFIWVIDADADLMQAIIHR